MEIHQAFNPNGVRILELLTENRDMRFHELNEAIKSSSTLARNLKALVKAGFVEIVPKVEGGKYVNLYKLTPLGERMAKLAREMKRL